MSALKGNELPVPEGMPMSEPSNPPAPPKKWHRGWIIFGVIVVALVGFELYASHLANDVANRAAALTGGVHGGINFDPNAVEATRSSSYGSTMIILNMSVLCPLSLLVILYWALSSRWRKPAPPAGGASGGN